MTRRRKSPIDVFFALPWWGSAIAAFASYSLLSFAMPLYIANTRTAASLQAYAPYVAVVFVALGLITYLRAVFVRRQFHSLDAVNDIRKLSLGQLEAMLAEVFRRRGYALATSKSNRDVDFILRKDGRTFLAQCQQWQRHIIGAQSVGDLVSVMSSQQASGGILIAAGHYTAEARALACRNSIELIDGKKLATLLDQVRVAQPFLDPTVRSREPTLIRPKQCELLCPICGGAMQQAVGERGAEEHDVFWRCKGFPECLGTRSL